MSRNEYLRPAGLNDPSAVYSHVVVAPAGRTVYIAGQYGGGEDGRLVSPDFADQVRRSYQNLGLALAAAGAEPRNVVKVTVLVVDHDESKLPQIRAASDDLFGPTKPASTLIGVRRLAQDGMLFEIDAIAVIPD